MVNADMGVPAAHIIPKRILFGNPEITHPLLSPDGEKLAYLAPVDNVMNIWVGSLGGTAFKPISKADDRGIRTYFWAENNQYILYLQDEDGDENWRLYSVNLETQETRLLTPFPDVQIQFLGRSCRFPNEVLIGANKRNPHLHDAYRLNLLDGEMKLVATNPGNGWKWIPNADLQVLGCLATRRDGGFDVLYRNNEDEDWRTLFNWGPEDNLNSSLVGFSRDGQYLYLKTSKGANAARLVALHTSEGNLEVLAEDGEYDIGEVMVHPYTRNVQAAAFTRARIKWNILDASIHEEFKTLEALDKGDFRVLSRDRADRTWIVELIVDDGPTAYYTFDRRTRTATHLFDDRPKLKDYALASMRPVSFQARDGLTIHGYLSLPPQTKAERSPLILNVHGGPGARDEWGFDPEIQWLANRGYACLQVNYRGSNGYGKAFLNAGNREWGGKVHDDLVDAVQWAIDEGVADPKRLAIYGVSFGGYAALVGATFTPDLFRCAVAVSGMSNLVAWVRSVPPYWSALTATIHRRYGDPETDEDFLKSRSPLFRVDSIRIPVLITQGATDPIVKREETEQIVAAMRERGLEYEYMLLPDEGHFFDKPENLIRFYATAEGFLARHLGGWTENGEV